MPRFSLFDAIQAVIALTIVLGAGPMIFIAWHWLPIDPARNVTASVFSFVTLVAGFFFGRHGVEVAREEARIATEREAAVSARAVEQGRTVESESAQAQELVLGLYRAASEYVVIVEAAKRDPVLKEKLEGLGSVID